MTQRKTCSIFLFAAYVYSIYLFIYKEGKVGSKRDKAN